LNVKIKNIINYIVPFLFIFFILYLFSDLHRTRPHNVTYLNDNWDFYLNGELVSSNFNTSTKFDKLKKGDVVELKNTIPNINYYDNTLEIDLKYCSVEVFIDGVLKYEYGLDNIKNDILIVDGIRRIPLGEDIANKEIYIREIIGESHAMSKINDIKIANENTLVSYFVKDNLLSIIAGCFLISLSLCVFLIIAFSSNKKYYDTQMFYIVLYILGIGLWLITHDGILLIIDDADIYMKYIEYIALYSCPISIIGYILNVKSTKTHEKVFKTKILSALYGFFVTFLIATTLLQFFNIIHFKQTLLYFHVSIVVLAAILIISIIRVLKKKLIANKFFFICFSIMAISICCEIFNLNFSFSGYKFIEFYFKNATLVGVSILLIAIIANYYKYIKNIFMENSKSEVLKEMAYTDALTGLNNRNWYEKYIAKLKGDYTMISMDLNNLKDTNDKLGHDKGDELIKRFANILKTTFSNNKIVRFGGDEFLVILQEPKDIAKQKLEEMNNFIGRLNSVDNDDIKVSVSYGVAYGEENYESTPNDIYKLADKRMYKMKKKIKKSKIIAND